MLKVAGHRPAMKLAHCSAMLEKIEICVLPSCASLHRARHATIDIFKLAGRRPAMKLAHCSALLEIIEICVLPSCASLHRATDAEIDIFKLAGRRPAMKRRLELKNATVCMLLIKVVHVSCEDKNP